MAKRFVDTDRYSKPWFRKLPAKMKLAWDYVLCRCDHRGVWPADFELMSFQVGEKIREEDFRIHMAGRYQEIEPGKFFFPSFWQFQYGKLNPNHNAHRGVIELLDRLSSNPSPTLGEPLGNPSPRVLDKEEEEEEAKEEGRGGVGEKPKTTPEVSFDAVWTLYPRKVNKSEARDRFHRLIKTGPDQERVLVALAKFRDYHAKKGTEADYVPHMATFLGTEKKPAWKDWLDPEAGQEQGFDQAGGQPTNWAKVFGDDVDSEAAS